ncbi:MAG: ABC transporter ATP-binding protein/permease [Gammaproteobacteria bacterium]|nr:ABC transporter ATP-binding protein/permease [Gammaproteobacteria bacterium]
MSPQSGVRTTARGDWRAARKLLPYLWQYRWRIAIGLVLLVAARAANITVPLVLKEIIDAMDAGETVKILVLPLAFLLAYGLLRFGSVLFNELRDMIFVRASVDIIHRIAMEVFVHLHRLSLGFHLNRKTGGLSRDVERGTTAIGFFLRIMVLNIVPVVLEIAAVLGILWYQFDILFALVTVAVIVVYAVFTYLVTRWRTRFRVEMNTAESSANTRSIDSLLNYETVKVFGNEMLERERYRDAMDDWARANMKSYYSLSLLNTGQGFIIAAGMTVLMVMAASGVVAGRQTLGDFAMINAFLIQLYIPLSFLGTLYRELNHSLIDMEKMFDLLDESPEVMESPGARPLALTRGEVRFEGVSFRYQDNRPVLEDINFGIPGGTMLAVVGPSGSGKSTLSRLLLRFYDPDSGRVTIDGQDVRELTLDSLRAVMGVVPQDTVLFNDTIGYNIGYGRHGASAGEIREAAGVAQIDAFIEQHSQGYDILVGERGLKLSGGEKQRVAIARTALKGARILIFDEATSSLDSRSEKAIQKALDRVAENCTTLVIAHRLSTVTHADHIIVLDRGRIVERGTHGSLVGSGGLYAQMWQLQQETQQYLESHEDQDGTGVGNPLSDEEGVGV